MEEEIKKRIKEKHEEIKSASDEVINENLHIMSRGYKGNDVLNVCIEGYEASKFLTYIEQSLFDEEDNHYYNWLLGRKPISYLFSMKNRSRAEAILSVLSVI